MYAFPGINITMLFGAFFLTAAVLLQLTRNPKNRLRAMFFHPYNKLSKTEQQSYDFKKMQIGESILLIALYLPLFASMILRSGILQIERISPIYERAQHIISIWEMVVFALLLIAGTTKIPLLLFKRAAPRMISNKYERNLSDLLLIGFIIAVVIAATYIILRHRTK